MFDFTAGIWKGWSSLFWLIDKVNLIESLSYHLLTNLTTTTIAAHSQSPLKVCLNLWCFKTVTFIWFYGGNMKELIESLVSNNKVNLIESILPLTHQLNNLYNPCWLSESFKKVLKLVVFEDCYLYLIPLQKYERVDWVYCVLLVDKVNLIVSIFYHLLTNLTTSTIATCSLSPLKKCLNLWCFNTVTCIWFHCGNMKQFIKFIVSE